MESTLDEQIEHIVASGNRGYITMAEHHLTAYIRITKRYNHDRKEMIETLEIGNIEVKKRYRGRGNCSSFLDAFERCAKKRKRAVFVEIVHSDTLAKILDGRKYTETVTVGSSQRDYWKFF